jgi:hypothetical protein
VQIIGPRIHIWSYDEGNASSRNSNPKVQPRDSSGTGSLDALRAFA